MTLKIFVCLLQNVSRMIILAHQTKFIIKILTFQILNMFLQNIDTSLVHLSFWIDFEVILFATLLTYHILTVYLKRV